MEGLANVSKIVDDVLVYANTFAEHQAAVRAFLERCQLHGITLNRAKTKLGLPQVKFAGFMIGRDGISVDPKKLAALKEFPQPTNVPNLRSFLGLVEQLAGFSQDVAAAMGPMRLLLSTKNPFVWTEEHDPGLCGYQGNVGGTASLSDVRHAARDPLGDRCGANGRLGVRPLAAGTCARRGGWC